MKLAPTLPWGHPTRNVLAGHFSLLVFFWGVWGGWKQKKPMFFLFLNMDGLGKKWPGFFDFIPAKLDAKWKQNLNVICFKLKGTCGRKKLAGFLFYPSKFQLQLFFLVFVLGFCRVNLFETWESYFLQEVSWRADFSGGRSAQAAWKKVEGTVAYLISFHLGMGNEHHLLTFNQSMKILEMSHDNIKKNWAVLPTG